MCRNAEVLAISDDLGIQVEGKSVKIDAKMPA